MYNGLRLLEQGNVVARGLYMLTIMKKGIIIILLHMRKTKFFLVCFHTNCDRQYCIHTR